MCEAAKKPSAELTRTQRPADAATLTSKKRLSKTIKLMNEFVGECTVNYLQLNFFLSRCTCEVNLDAREVFTPGRGFQPEKAPDLEPAELAT